MTQVLIKPSSGVLQAHQPYYAAEKNGTLLGLDGSPVSSRAGIPIQTYEGHRKRSLQLVEFSHLLITAADLGSATVQPGGQVIDAPSPIVIDGVAVQVGDFVDISKTLAATLRSGAGRFEAVTTQQLALVNPPRYTATSPDNFGGRPWRFRLLADGTIEGLAVITPTNVSGSFGGTFVSGLLRVFDNNWNTFADFKSLNSGQSGNWTYDRVDFIRMEMMCSSVKLAVDAGFPKATFGWRMDNSWVAGPIGYLFKNSITDQWAWNGAHTYSNGNWEFWYTDVLTNAWSSSMTVNDSGNSRLELHHVAFLGVGGCRISIGGEFPDVGAIVEIPPAVAASMKPAIAHGDYVVVENSGLNNKPWQIRKV